MEPIVFGGALGCFEAGAVEPAAPWGCCVPLPVPFPFSEGLVAASSASFAWRFCASRLFLVARIALGVMLSGSLPVAALGVLFSSAGITSLAPGVCCCAGVRLEAWPWGFVGDSLWEKMSTTPNNATSSIRPAMINFSTPAGT